MKLFKLFDLDWRKSTPHLHLLSLFLKARGSSTISYGEWGRLWKEKLNEHPEKALKRFIGEGMLIPASPKQVLDVRFVLADLKDICRKYKLPVSGKKAELIDRIISNVPETILGKWIQSKDVYVCSDIGRPIAEAYANLRANLREDAEQQSLQYLKARNFSAACQTMATFEARQVFPRGLGIDWSSYNPKRNILVLKQIFNGKPKFLSGRSMDQLNVLRIGAGMAYLWGTKGSKKWLPPDFQTGLPFDNEVAARMLHFYASNEADLQEYRKSRDIKGVKIGVVSDSCEACKRLENKSFSFNNVPELPYEKCTSPKGCRCSYTPIMLSWKELGKRIGVDLSDLD